jgi:ketopantoate reductase
MAPPYRKLNAALNPVSAFALATVGHGQIERLRQMDAAVGGFKTSIYQDIERARPLELDTSVGVAEEIADLVGVAVPFTKTVLGLLRSRAKTPMDTH